MGPELWSLLIASGTFAVIAASAYAALAQLRHLNTTNQLNSLLFFLNLERNKDLQEDFRFLHEDYKQLAAQREFIDSLLSPRVDKSIHRELNVCGWDEEVGALLKHKLIIEDAFLDMVCPQIILRDWSSVQPTIAARRSLGGSTMYMNFEYLAARSQKFLRKSPNGIYPSDTPRLHVGDLPQSTVTSDYVKIPTA
jgi:hypothetical protein